MMSEAEKLAKARGLALEFFKAHPAFVGLAWDFVVGDTRYTFSWSDEWPICIARKPAESGAIPDYLP